MVDWDPRAFYANVIADEAALDHFLTQVATPEWHGRHDAGRPFAENAAELIERHPAHADAIRMWGERFVEQIGPPLSGMAELIGDLAAAHVPLYALTNFSAEFWPAFAAREAALLAPFRDILVSGEVGLVKPDPAIYALALDRFGLAAAEALFVDDRADNVAAADAMGFHGHRFVDAATLRLLLADIGLLGQEPAP